MYSSYLTLLSLDRPPASWPSWGDRPHLPSHRPSRLHLTLGLAQEVLVRIAPRLSSQLPIHSPVLAQFWTVLVIPLPTDCLATVVYPLSTRGKRKTKLQLQNKICAVYLGTSGLQSGRHRVDRNWKQALERQRRLQFLGRKAGIYRSCFEGDVT